jgi:type IV pilus assembly protein PilV
MYMNSIGLAKSPVSAAWTRGFSLLEVLVAVLILSVGLLGIAGLQVTGLRYASAANMQYVASLQVLDMAERMRANMAGVSAGAYNSISGTGSDPGCISSSCTASQMAATDAYQWNTANARVLPSGTGTVTRNGSLFTINISWNESSGLGTAPQARSISVTFQP